MASRPSTKDEAPSASEQQNKPQSSNTGFPTYLSAALRLPTSYPLGATGTDRNMLGPSFTGASVTVPVPGVLVIDYLPTLGVSDGPTSPLNRAMYNEFNTIRSQISGNRPYQPADHMIYRMCVDGLRDLYHYVRRIYGITRVYSATNLYRPRAILDSMGLDADSWINNANALYQWLLNHRQSLTPFPTVPIGRISSRHVGFNTYMFTDGEIDSTQTYILNQKAFYSYENVDEVKGATLRSFPSTYNAFLAMWDEMYTALQTSSDVYIIAADIRRAFAEKAVVELPDTPVDLTVEYVKLDPVLASIMNANILHISPTNYEAFKVRDGLDMGLLCAPEWAESYTLESLQNNYQMLTAKLGHLNMVQAQPSEADIWHATRLRTSINVSTVLTSGASISQTVGVLEMGTEVIVGARIYGFNSDMSGAAMDISSAIVMMVNGTGGYNGNARLVAQILGTLACFDWHPPVYVIYGATTSAGGLTAQMVGRIEDIQNYVPLTDENLSIIHEAAILAEFEV